MGQLTESNYRTSARAGIDVYRNQAILSAGERGSQVGDGISPLGARLPAPQLLPPDARLRDCFPRMPAYPGLPTDGLEPASPSDQLGSRRLDLTFRRP